ncbi:RNA polymerase sigma factor [Candidatus Parcubacteria bacterium]|uniref:RNA polymerase sigma factor n=1 Tax=Candidatus Berkelbacteria bacterium CG_4_10_14_0_8_um_filter_42_34 TaxID=1974502 RepID=A0A2M7SW35_9BACT|nr:RNA polymerase sigma factor [Candidatus Parcubacteria bacterium]PIZ27388.1 MAG: hypothetical protein COY45_02695 [Candidatus Berkelbacteria bacterium CG_4_10_14_0_8_um_filter_42_34]
MDPILEQKFINWYDEYADAIFRHCYFRVNNRELAKELVQETFIRVFEYFKKHEIENVKPFLYKVATNLVIDYFRKKRIKEISIEELYEKQGFEPASSSSQEIISSLEIKDILQGLNQLEDGDRQVVMMRYFDGLEPKEIAEILNENSNIISVRLSRAIKKLKELLLKNGK